MILNDIIEIKCYIIVTVGIGLGGCEAAVVVLV